MLDAAYTQWPGLAQSFKLEQWVWEPGAAVEALYAVRYGITALNKAEADAERIGKSRTVYIGGVM